MRLKITSVLARWKNGVRLCYRTADQGFETIQKVLEQSESDIFLFPGGFIVDDDANKRRNIKNKLQSLCSRLERTLITGFDKRDMKEDEPDGQLLILCKNGFYSIRQSAKSHDSHFKRRRAEQKRIFPYTKNGESINIGVISCGEMFNKDFRKIFDKQAVEQGIPCLLFNPVHNGDGWQSEPCRKHLNHYYKCASFYTYHLKNIPGLLKDHPKYSNLAPDEIKTDVELGVMHYFVDTSKEYPKFKINNPNLK